MQAVIPVTITTPDGVERTLRATQGARNLIWKRYKADIKEILDTEGDTALPFMLWALMHDEDGNPPDITAKRIEFTMPPDSAPLMGAVFSAFSQGKMDPNEATAMVREAMEAIAELERLKKSSSTSGGTVAIPSVSPTENSGGDIATTNSLPLPEPTETQSADETSH